MAGNSGNLGDPGRILPARADKNCHESSHPGQASEATEREGGKGSRELGFCILKLPVGPELRRWLVAVQANGGGVSRATVPLEFQARYEAQFSTTFSSDEKMLLCAVQKGCYWSHVATEHLTDS